MIADQPATAILTAFFIGGLIYWILHPNLLQDLHQLPPETIGILCLAAFLFLPTLIAILRGATHSFSIFLVNLVLGASGVGYIYALIWALNDEDRNQRIRRHSQQRRSERFERIMDERFEHIMDKKARY